MKNGQEVSRKYLYYSPSKRALFCIPCRLFRNADSKFGTEGYNDRRNVNRDFNSHENSHEHLESRQKFLSQSRLVGRVDTGLHVQTDEEFNYWRNDLRRVVSVVKKLAGRGIAFRGKTEKFESNKNGNFMMALELISEFDTFLATHIAARGNPGRGKTYLSSTICDEFISLIASNVRKVIIAEIKDSKH